MILSPFRRCGQRLCASSLRHLLPVLPPDKKQGVTHNGAELRHPAASLWKCFVTHAPQVGRTLCGMPPSPALLAIPPLLQSAVFRCTMGATSPICVQNKYVATCNLFDTVDCSKFVSAKCSDDPCGRQAHPHTLPLSEFQNAPLLAVKTGDILQVRTNILPCLISPAWW